MPGVREFLAFVAELFEVPESTVSLETAYGSFPQWDSVMHLRLVMEVEERFGLSIPFERIPEIRTLGDFLRES